MWRILKKMGFRFRLRHNRLHLLERKEIKDWRARFLRKYFAYKAEGRKIYFQDETWINEGYTTRKAWYDTLIEGQPELARQPGTGLAYGYKDPTGKGKRLIISHCGSSDGFLPSGLLVFESVLEDGDYHKEMTSAVFEQYVEKQIFSQLERGSVLVLDNAPYHSRLLHSAPSLGSKKADMLEWLKENGIPHDPTLKTTQIYEKYIFNERRQEKYRVYAVDERAKEFGIDILRLPPYHCQFNPIELVWSEAKRASAKRNVTFKMIDMKQILVEEFRNVSAETWAKYVVHAEKEMTEWCQRDGILLIPVVKPLVIYVDSDDDDDEEEGAEWDELLDEEYEVSPDADDVMLPGVESLNDVYENMEGMGVDLD